MFLDALSKIGTSTISIPISMLMDSTGQVMSSVGVGIPAASAAHLAKIGLFDHSVAESIAKSIFESSGQTFTGRWMDASGPFKHLYPDGVKVGWHRIHGHHFITDAISTYKNPSLSVVDFYRHLATDVVTVNGLPLLPESAIRGIADILNVSVNKVMPWVSMNILDIGASIFAVGHAGGNVISVLNGSAQWGVGYALDTFGIGAAEMARGFASSNPLLIASGSVDIACGSVTAYNYYSQEFFCGIPASELLQSAALGSGLAAILASIEIYCKRDSYSARKKLNLLAERITTGGLLSCMSAIAVPLSITTTFGIVGCKLAVKAASETDRYVEAIPTDGKLAALIDEYFVDKYVGADRFSRMNKYLEDPGVD